MIELNLLGILVATITGMVLGALWYSPVLFQRQWMAGIGKTPETLGSQTAAMIGSIVASLLSAIGVSLLFTLCGIASLSGAVSLGAILGLFIIFPALLSDNLFCGWGTPLLMIQSGYRVLSVLLMSVAIYYVA